MIVIPILFYEIIDQKIFQTSLPATVVSSGVRTVCVSPPGGDVMGTKTARMELTNQTAPWSRVLMINSIVLR